MSRFVRIALLFAASVSHVAQAAPVATPVRNVPQTYHGTVVDDPYRWLEDTDAAETKAWMRAQADATQRVIDRIPGRAQLLKQMLDAENAVAARALDVTRTASGHVFFTRRAVGAAHPALYVRSSLNGEDRMLIDVAARGAKTALDYFFPSPDGKRVAYGLSSAGSERAALYVMDVGSGRDIAGPFADAMWNGNGVSKWERDGKAFSFITLREPGTARSKTEAFEWNRTWRWSEDRPAAPTLVFDAAKPLGPAMIATESAQVFRYPDSAWEIMQVEDGVRRDSRALKRKVGSGESFAPFLQFDDGVSRFQVRGDTIYAVSRINAPRYQVVATSLVTPDWKSPHVVLPAGDYVVDNLHAARDALYVSVRDGARFRLFRIDYRSFAREEIVLPFPGTLRLHTNDNAQVGVLVSLGGWTNVTQHYAVGPKDSAVQLTTLQPRSGGDSLPGISSRVEMARSHDGVMVPLSIVQKDGAAKTGKTPTLIWAYGAYGFSQNPSLRSEYAGWLNAGYAYVNCHVRGGGEYGEAWYTAGKIATKANTWKDLIACAEHLIATGVTTPAKLGIVGRSAGGIAVGRAMTERPELFAVAAPGVGVLDAVRAETEPNGAGNTMEFGTVKQPDEFRALLAMSAYHHVKAGVKYPAAILPHGVNDSRVAVWQSSKMAAALQAARPDAKPVLLDLDYQAGHGRGSSREQQLASFANVLAFFLWQMGEPGFQPAAP
ncbi:MAG: prolyl oligopeptidase family serine peptidase [Burkholderiales bacterium]|nr:prolyl oligopeptidase family serine peptidase [Burkholderiales bacterium]